MRFITIFLLAGGMLAVAERGAANAATAQSDALLDVPYVSQTSELCGGAAVAMVLRYWGERDVFPQDFAPLLGASSSGILTGALTAAVRNRGWQAQVAPTDEDDARTWIRSEIDRGRPLIALIEVEPQEYHYVVIVGGADQGVVLHDPARAPFRVLRWTEFDRAWMATGRWAMLVLPPNGQRNGDESPSATHQSAESGNDADEVSCTAIVESGAPMPLASESTDQGLPVVVEPRIDTIDVHGAERTRPPVIVRVAGLHPRQVLTDEMLEHAQRRLDELPVASTTRVTDEPIADGLARVDIVIVERPVVPNGWLGFAIVGARALFIRELRLDVAGSMGAGEVVTAAWRWSSKRPRVTVGLTVPSPQWLPGILALDGLWERQSYQSSVSFDGGPPTREERRKVGVHVADWSTSWLRWQAGAALDHLRAFDEHDQNRFPLRDYLAVESTLDARLAADRLAFSASLGWWAPFAHGDRFATGELLAAWRSTAESTRPFWSAVTAMAIANRVAPLALWQGAGTGQGRSALLRAHPLLEGDVITGPAFGRGLAHGTLEYERPVRHMSMAAIAIAGFVDAARAWHRLNGLETSPVYLDAGFGVRVRGPHLGGAIRVDVAHGLRGGGTTLSAGWGEAWPH